MAKTAKNKMKYWRRMANKVTIQVTKKREIVDADGNKSVESYDEPVTLTGRQLKNYTVSAGSFKAPTGLLKKLMTNVGLIKIDIEDAVVPTGENE